MKRIILFITLFFTFQMSLYGSTDEIVLRNAGHQHDHIEHYDPADMPIAYFDSEAMEIIIEAEGYADYYVVEVISMVSGQTLIYTQIDGYGDTIDISALPDAYYQIIITSSNNNVFEGTFLIE